VVGVLGALEAVRALRASHEFQIVNSDYARHCDPRIVAAADAVALPYKHLVSRAYHDTVFMGHICPVGMIFVPSQGGSSHRPEEYTSPKEIGQGVQVLALTLADLAQ
jgi:ureidoglycolate amidohydrolase